MPSKNILSVTDATQKAYAYILREDYAKKTCQQYWYCGVVPIRRYCEQHGIKTYSSEGLNKCVFWFREQYEQGDLYYAKFRCIRKIVSLMECSVKDEPSQRSTLKPWGTTVLAEPYCTLLENYAEYRQRNGCKETTVRGAKPIVRHFLMHVSSMGHKNIRSVTSADIISYIPKLAENYHSVGGALSVLRGFGNFLLENGYTAVNLGNAFSISVPSRKKLHVGFTQEEAVTILSGIDRSTDCGKRDYAILMLAMHTGLRGIDILKLRFTSIDWEKREIRLSQSKTSKELTVPVPINVLNAIAEYILYARPKSSEKYIIFLRTRKPYVPMKTWSAHSIVHRNAARAGIEWSSLERKGFHSFRRAIANWMLEAEIPLEMITEVLGQTNTDSTRPYLAVHQSGLADCVLGMGTILMGRGELR